MSSHGSLDAAAQERKARLARLKSLKRKQPSEDPSRNNHDANSNAMVISESSSQDVYITKTYLSGRNFDAETRGPKLGFEVSPAANAVTLEQQATALATDVRSQAQKQEEEDKPVDIFKLQPKKPNWDLKRELDKKLDILNTRTANAIARVVRERIENAKKEKEKALQANGQTSNTDEEAEEVGMDGQALMEAMNVKEKEKEEEARREREEEEEEEEEEEGGGEESNDV